MAPRQRLTPALGFILVTAALDVMAMGIIIPVFPVLVEEFTGSNAQADVALARARKLIEQDNADIVLGPLSGAEGIALRDYSRTLTGKTIVNGSSGASDTTLRNPSPNFFRFSTDGTQWMAGLGRHVYQTMGVREVAVTAGDYAFPYSQVFGFNLEFCRLGGRATQYWAPLGTTDFGAQIAQINRSNAGAVVVVHGGTDGLAFMTQYAQAGGNKPLVGGSIMADQTMLSARGPHRRVMVGMISGGPIADVIDDAGWRDFVERYRRRWLAEQSRSPSPDALSYFDAVPRSWALDPQARYPMPLVDLAEGRARALAALKARDA